MESESFFQAYTIKVISTSRETLSPPEICRLRDLMLKLLAIHQDFSSVSKFLRLVKKVASTAISCFAVYLLVYSVSIFKLVSGQGDMQKSLHVRCLCCHGCGSSDAGQLCSSFDAKCMELLNVWN